MVRLELTEDEVILLRRMLEVEAGELGMEIAATDKLSLREALKRDKEVLRRVLAKVREPVPA